MHTPAQIGQMATLACLLEASAEKPGNVTPTHAFRDMAYEDFLRSAVAIGPELGRAAERGVGATVLAAIKATRCLTSANTNLGIVLLLTPLARASLLGGELRAGLRAVLSALTLDDAHATYAAIRLALPGGFATTEQHDIHAAPTVTLLEAMASAAARDSVAAEYASGYAITFERGLPALQGALSRGAGQREAVVQTYLELLAALPDSLIARKLGQQHAHAVSAQAAQVLAAGGVFSPQGRAAIVELDAALRDPDNRRNPGTSADLTAATLFVALIEGFI